MENGFNNMEELISKYLAGEADGEETARLEAWCRQSPANEELFDQGRKLFDAMAGAGVDEGVDVDAAWNKLEARIGAESGAKVVPLKKRFGLVRVAASVLLLAALGVIVSLIFTTGGPQPVVVAAGATTSEQKLPDGSKVFMNRNAEISYAITKNRRAVKLKGEAYFDVVHNNGQPFVVEVDGIFIKDIGTAFNVKALPGGKTVEVLVESGEVQFYSETSEGLKLVKGEKAIYNKATGTFTKQQVEANDNSVSYHSKVFHFNNASLREVVEQVNAVYGSDIRLGNEAIGNCRLSVEFNNEDMDVLVSVIAETLDLEAEHKGNTVVLKGTACP